MSAISKSTTDWIDTDKIFALDSGWFFGSRRGVHVGPYENHRLARVKADQVGRDLGELDSGEARLRYFRDFLRKERLAVGASAQTLPAANASDGQDPDAVRVRAGEHDKVWYRSGRFFRIDNVWFFSTREGIDVGPFGSEGEARRHERRLVAMLSNESAEQAHRTIYEYNTRPTAGLQKAKPRR